MASVLGGRAAGVRLSVGGGSVPPAEGAAFAEAVGIARPDLLVLSRDEAAALGAIPEELVRALVVTTAGTAGSSANVGAERIEVAAPALDGTPVDATGTGDAYAAALIDALAHLGEWPPPPAELRNAMELASRLGAETARVDGAQGRVPSEGGDEG